jgi:hypothetical protein
VVKITLQTLTIITNRASIKARDEEDRMDQDERKVVDEMDEEATFGAGLFLEGEKFEKAKADESESE